MGRDGGDFRQTRRGAAKNPSVLGCWRCWSASLAKLAAVALANKMARIAWKLMVSGEPLRSAPTLGPRARRPPDRDRAGSDRRRRGLAGQKVTILQETERDGRIVRSATGVRDRTKPTGAIEVAGLFGFPASGNHLASSPLCLHQNRPDTCAQANAPEKIRPQTLASEGPSTHASSLRSSQ